MQPFNLTRLNMFSPYPVWPVSYTHLTAYNLFAVLVLTGSIREVQCVGIVFAHLPVGVQANVCLLYTSRGLSGERY